jgi:tetratricopeptide (TPR) repeat protein
MRRTFVILKRLLIALPLLAVIAGVGLYVWSETALRHARSALDQHDVLRGRRFLAECARLKRNNAEWRLLAARADRMAGDLDTSEQRLVECQRLEGQPSDESSLEWALIRAQRGEVEPVEEFLRTRVNRDDPHATLILEALGLGYLVVYRPYDAMNCVRQWLERAPDHPRARLLRGRIHHRIHAFGNAVDDFRAALADDPDNDEVGLLLANSLIENSQAPDAIPYLKRLREHRPDDAGVLVKLAFSLNMVGATEPCRVLLDEVLAKQPTLSPALSARGQLELQLQHPAEAERLLRQALKSTPQDRQTQFALSRSLRQQPGREKEAEEAEKHLAKIEKTIARMIEVSNHELAQHPTDPKLNYELATLLVEMGYEREAERWFHKALQYDPQMTAAHRALADYYEKHGQRDLAEAHRAKLKEAPK